MEILRSFNTGFRIHQVLNAFFLFAAMALVAEVAAAPSGGRVLQGSVTITYGPQVTRVVQTSEHAVILWQGFGLTAGERLEIVQPSLNSRLINRVTQNSFSEIRGNIQSNGQVMILNPYGVYHQSSARATVGGLVLSGMDWRTSNVSGDTVRLYARAADAGIVRNLGVIETAPGGNVALVGRRVVNQGPISAASSSVVLAVGRAASLLFEKNGLLNLNISEEELPNLAEGSSPLVNTGDINAPSGRILLTASRTSRVFQSLGLSESAGAADSQIALAPGANFGFGGGVKLTNRGRLNAGVHSSVDGALPKAGHVVLLADAVESSGWIRVDTWEEGYSGQVVIAAANQVHLTRGISLAPFDFTEGGPGTLTILGRTLVIDGGSIQAHRGSSVIIGGKGTQLASNLGDTESVVVTSNIDGYYGPPTNISIWANNTVDVSGHMHLDSAQGSKVEIVSGDKLRYRGTIGSNAYLDDPKQQGTLLLKAKNLSVKYLDEPWTVNALSLSRALTGTAVTLQATQNLTVGGDPSVVFLAGDWTLSDDGIPHNSLSLLAGNDLLVKNVDMSSVDIAQFQADNDIRISYFTASADPYVSQCSISAGRNVDINNSIFVDWCYSTIPRDIIAGGELTMNNVFFFEF